MRILHVSAQKPHSTGSGVYLSGLVEGFKEKGYEQALIAGLDREELLQVKEVQILKGIDFYPLRYNTKEMNFPILGMSDVMPYPSTRYRDLNEEMLGCFRSSLTNLVEEVLAKFQPDIIISHHLYLATAILREIAPKEVRIIGICHGTCLRQLQSHDLQRDYIQRQIAKLDFVLTLHEEQRAKVIQLFDIDCRKVIVIGSGYDHRIFYKREARKPEDRIELVYTGKISRSKGLFSLVKALERIVERPSYRTCLRGKSLRLRLIGGGNNEEKHQITELAKSSPYILDVLGRLETQEEIAQIYAESHIFILPSFYEGLPLVIIEAMACGMQVVTSDIPGVQSWIQSVLGVVPQMSFVPLPAMQTMDVPVEEELPAFEDRLAEAIAERIENLHIQKASSFPKVQKLSWQGLCERIEKAIFS